MNKKYCNICGDEITDGNSHSLGWSNRKTRPGTTKQGNTLEKIDRVIFKIRVIVEKVDKESDFCQKCVVKTVMEGRV
jgi:hypothetical protein